MTIGADGGGRPREFRLPRPMLLLLGGGLVVTWVVAALLVAGVVRGRNHEARIAELERELAAARAEALAASALREELDRTRALQDDLLAMLGLTRATAGADAQADSVCDLPAGVVSVDAPPPSGVTAPDIADPHGGQAEPGAPPSRWPAAGVIVRGFEPGDPARGREGHPGVDIAGTEGAKVVAAAAGDVDFVGEDEVLGKYVEIRHGLDWVTIYANCQSIKVGPGHHVRAGEQVAKMGRTGRAPAPQLHFQVWRHGVAVDPRQYISGEPAAR
ncbi:MAG: M23 family metallopeptidase [bacterium]|nr:M23 family metallopeptidase [bacterium]